MAGTMRDTAAGDIDGFTSAIDGVKTAIFNVVSGPLRGVITGMTEWVSANSAVVALSRPLVFGTRPHAYNRPSTQA